MWAIHPITAGGDVMGDVMMVALHSSAARMLRSEAIKIMTIGPPEHSSFFVGFSWKPISSCTQKTRKSRLWLGSTQEPRVKKRGWRV